MNITDILLTEVNLQIDDYLFVASKTWGDA